MHDGLFLIDKEPDCTSHDVVQQVRRILGQRKIGHCGTLDPGATGLLVLTLGRATRLTRFLIRAPKIYEGEIRFGATTDTYDRHGEVTAEASIADLETEIVTTGPPRRRGSRVEKGDHSLRVGRYGTAAGRCSALPTRVFVRNLRSKPGPRPRSVPRLWGSSRRAEKNQGGPV